MTKRPARIGVFRALWTRLHFVRHLGEMFVVMMIGMPLGRVFFAAFFGSGSDEAVREHDLAWALIMAFAMTLPMVAVMIYRGHSTRSAGEMVAVMLAPALALVGLKVCQVIDGPVSGLYMSASTLAMIALIVYRRSEYRTAAAAHA
jgi:hypothetical protein